MRAIVIGSGEVGRRIAAALVAAGWSTDGVSRTHGWDRALAEDGDPRILAMREEDLSAALERFPRSAAPRLVLVQNGFLEARIADLGGVTRGLLWFTSKGDFFRVLAPSLFHGPHAAALAAALNAGGLAAAAVDAPHVFLREMVLKAVWNCVVGLPLAVHNCDLATYLREYRDEATALLAESARAANAEYDLDVTGPEAWERLTATTGDLGWVRGGAKALAFRNGAVAYFGRRHGIETPLTDGLLSAAGLFIAGAGPPRSHWKEDSP